MKKLMYILLLLLFAANLAAQENYVIDSVCAGADRYYRIDTKDKGSTWEWILKDTLGNELAKPTGTDFWVENSPGDTTWGSEINIIWNDVGIFDLLTLHYSSHGCDTLEQGRVNVYEPPGADAGEDLIICSNQPVVLSSDSAWNYSSLIWTSTGDGTFANNTQLNPTYFPGINDSITGSVTLILTVNGMAVNVTCDPAIDSVRIQINNPLITLSFTNLLCYNDSSGWVKAIVTGGIEPYSYNWTGPGTFSATGDSIYKLAAGKYKVTVSDQIGCEVTDSIEITEPLELLANISTDVSEICEIDTIRLNGNPAGGTGILTHAWTGDGAVYLNSIDIVTPYFRGAPTGVYTLIYSIIDENGCIAGDTVSLKVIQSKTSVTDKFICAGELPFIWNDSTYTTFGSYINIIPNTTGCDSVMTLNIFELPSTVSVTDTLICAGELPYTWNGINYNSAGTYTKTLVNTAGCDSLLTLNLNVLPSTTGITNATVCDNELPYTWNGINYNSAGTYTKTLVNTAGCDSLLTLNLNVLPSTTGITNATVCDNELPYTWNGINYNSAGTYSKTLVNAAGCDSLLTLNLNVLPSTTGITNATVCDNELPYTWNGINYNSAGTYSKTLVNAAGCDSLLTLNLNVLPSTTGITNATVCDNELPYTWNGINYNSAGTYTKTLVNTAGCDSLLTLNLNVLPSTTGITNATVCDNELPYTWNGINYNSAGTYSKTLVNAAGCDSLLTLNLNVLPSTTGITNATVCDNELPYTWNGINYNSAGTYSKTLVNAAGCDSLLTLNLNVLPSTTGITNATVCDNELPYTWNGINYNSAGTYSKTLVNTAGCDSLLTLNLNVLPSTVSVTDTFICASELPYSWNGINYNSAGTYSKTLVNAAGCDSLLTLNLNVVPIYNTDVKIQICNSQLPYNWNGQTLLTAGIYVDSMISIAGCDSVITLTLLVQPVIFTPSVIEICSSQLPYLWHGFTFPTGGTYFDTLSNVAGCDSVIVMNLIVIPSFSGTENIEICNNELPFNWNGMSLAAAGVYKDTLSTVAGCDSIVTLTLNIQPDILVTEQKTICENELPYTWFGQTFITASTIVISVPSVTTGCDTILTLQLQTVPDILVTEQKTICENELPYTWFGQTFITAGTIVISVPSVTTGCDTILTLQLQTVPDILVTEQKTICENELPYTWFGQTFITAGTIVISVPSVTTGCDTILTLQLQTVPDILVTEQKTICENELPYTWFGQTFITAGTIVISVPSVTTGCDTILTLQLQTVPDILVTEQKTICENELPYTWFGQTFTTANTVIINVPSTISACDTIRTLELQVDPAIPVSVTIVANRTEITEGETVTFTATPVNGGVNPVYAWFVNGVLVTGETLATYTFKPNNSDVIYAVLTSDLACVSGNPAESNKILIKVGVIPGEIVIQANPTAVDCYGNSTGAIELTVTGGTGIYTYEWSNGETTQNIYSLTSGTYSVTVTDSDGLSKQISVVITEPAELVLAATKVDVGDSSDPVGSINLTVTGGTKNYKFDWKGPNGFTSANEDINKLEAGNYTVLVTDAHGCSGLLAVVIAGYGMTCPPPVIVECGIDQIPVPFTSLADYEAAGGLIESTFDLVEGTFKVSPDVSDGKKCPETITRTYSIQNSNGDWITCEQLIIIHDIIKPVLVLKRFDVQCPEDKPAIYTNRAQFEAVAGNQATDECELDWSTFRFVRETSDLQKCPEQIIRWYEIKDMCDNATLAKQTIIIDDKIKPYAMRPLKDLFTACEIPQPYRNRQDIEQYSGGYIIENCNNGNYTVTHVGDSEPVGNECPVTIIRTYRFTDLCGNFNEYKQNIIINDTIPPVISCPKDVAFDAGQDKLASLTGLAFSNAEITIAIKDTAKLDISAKDNCKIKAITYYDEVAGDCPAVVTRTFTVYDGCGNTDICEQKIELYNKITPLFAATGPFCKNSVAPLLPKVSTNGITGTWSPAIITTSVVGTSVYKFTPAAGQCAVPVTMNIEITNEIIPLFAATGPFCQNSVALLLPKVSENGITGTWSPAMITTSVAETTTYKFTPAAGQCAVPVTMDIEITDGITPVFLQPEPFCKNSIAPALPLVSENGITGTWNPATIETSSIGISVYKFTPAAGQCAVPVTMNIEITDGITPVFLQPGPFCQNSIAPALPLVSENGITGTWNPATIETSSIGTFTYKFTPAAGQCAVPVTMNIEITDGITPVFLQPGPFCQNSVAPALPLVSENGITGTWNPATIETSSIGISVYKFTPAAGQCAVPVTMNIEITDGITPVFLQPEPFCQNSIAPALPLVSENGITGTWNPATIETSSIGTFTYTFTPAAGQCAVPVTMDIEITDGIPPVFLQPGPFCQNSVAPALPLVSENGITGTWNPATIETSSIGISVYTFTPDAGQCAVPVTMPIEITDEIKPVFAALGPLCPNSIAPLLPSVSTNGVAGTWNPATIETNIPGTFTYTFTPDSGQCAKEATLEIEISDKIPPVAICRDITVYLDADGKASVTTSQINNGSNDNCKLDTLYLSRYNFGCADVGKNPVTLTAVDAVGLRDSCVATVTVLDTIKPVVVCRGPFEIQLDENAEYKLTVAEVLEDASDICGIDTMYVYPHELNCDHIGLTTVTLWVVGVNGDSSYCQTDVTIYGNRAPNVVDDSARTIENVPVVIDVVENDFDEKTSIDISTLAVTIKPLYGKVTINPVNGDFTYTPDLNFSGVDVLEYRIYDDGIPCEPEFGKAFVYIIVEPLNDKPVAVDDYYDAGCFSVVRNVVEDNDRDPDSDNLQINTNPLTPPNHGELIIDPDGTINYFPNEGFVGIDSFEYVVCDNGIPSLCDTAKVYINVDCNEESQESLECELFIPEGFSPNGDGIHDFFRIMCINNYPDAKLMIFNRNGNLLWEKEHYGNYDVWGDQNNAWWWGTSVLNKYDIGKQMINGEPKLKVGNYVYVLQLGNREVKNGTVMISY